MTIIIWLVGQRNDYRPVKVHAYVWSLERVGARWLIRSVAVGMVVRTKEAYFAIVG